MDSPQVDEFVSYRDILPAECVPISGLRLINALDADGARCFFWRVDGDEEVSSFLSSLEYVKHSMLHRQATHNG